MSPAITQAAAAERTRDMYAAAAARRPGAEIRRSRRAQHSQRSQRSQPSVSAQRTRRGFRIRHALRAA